LHIKTDEARNRIST